MLDKKYRSVGHELVYNLLGTLQHLSYFSASFISFYVNMACGQTIPFYFLDHISYPNVAIGKRIKIKTKYG